MSCVHLESKLSKPKYTISLGFFVYVLTQAPTNKPVKKENHHGKYRNYPAAWRSSHHDW